MRVPQAGHGWRLPLLRLQSIGAELGQHSFQYAYEGSLRCEAIPTENVSNIGARADLSKQPIKLLYNCREYFVKYRGVKVSLVISGTHVRFTLSELSGSIALLLNHPTSSSRAARAINQLR